MDRFLAGLLVAREACAAFSAAIERLDQEWFGAEADAASEQGVAELLEGLGRVHEQVTTLFGGIECAAEEPFVRALEAMNRADDLFAYLLAELGLCAECNDSLSQI